MSSRVNTQKGNCWSTETALSQFYMFSTIFFVSHQPKILSGVDHLPVLFIKRIESHRCLSPFTSQVDIIPKAYLCVFYIKSKKGPSWRREMQRLRDRVFSGHQGWRRDGQEGVGVRGSLNKLKSRCYEGREAPLQRRLDEEGVVLSVIEIANGKRFAKSIQPLSGTRECQGR